MQVFFSEATHQLYKHVAKPVFFAFDAEAVHHHMVALGSFLGKSSPLKDVLHWAWAFQSPSLVKKVNGIRFKNPVGLAAGFDYNADLLQTLPAVGFGFHTIGTVTLEPYVGNTPPRLGRFPKSQALLVNKGLKSIGAHALIKKIESQKFSIPVGISIASTNRAFKNEQEQIENIADCFALFEHSKVKHSYYELNISCPNTFGGEPFTTPAKLERLLKKIDRLQIHRPLFAKMPIDQDETETLQLLKVLDKHRVQGVIFGNLTKDKKNPAIHPDDRALWKKRKGNVSGKPTWERSNRCIALTKKKFGDRFTIIGTGGVFNGADAQHKIELGADLIQLITGMIYEGPQVIGAINKYLATHPTRSAIVTS